MKQDAAHGPTTPLSLAVSQELRTARQAVAATVRTLGYDPVSQDDFPTGHGELRRWLCQQIDESEGLLQLVGQAYGAEPPRVDPTYGRVSYTQLEFLYAGRQGKKTWVILIGDQCPRDKPMGLIDLPDDTNHPDQGSYQAERRALQRRYIKQLTLDNLLRYTVQNQTELQNVVLRLRDELGELRRGEQRRWQRLTTTVTTTVTAILLVLAFLGGGGWWAYNVLHTEVQQVAVVDAAKIRGHLRSSVEETYRRELADAGAVTSWEERGGRSAQRHPQAGQSARRCRAGSQPSRSATPPPDRRLV